MQATCGATARRLLLQYLTLPGTYSVTAQVQLPGVRISGFKAGFTVVKGLFCRAILGLKHNEPWAL